MHLAQREAAWVLALVVTASDPIGGGLGAEPLAPPASLLGRASGVSTQWGSRKGMQGALKSRAVILFEKLFSAGSPWPPIGRRAASSGADWGGHFYSRFYSPRAQPAPKEREGG